MPAWLKPVADSLPGRFISHILRRYFRHDVGRQSAALAYYLLFALFPFMIFLSSLLGLLDLNVSGILASLSHLLPGGVLAVIEEYLGYVSRTSSAAMLWFGLVFSIYFPMRAADCLMAAVRRAYHLGGPKNRLVYRVKVLLFTVFLLVSIALTLFLTTVGERALTFLGKLVPLAPWFVALWGDLRFVVLGVVMFASVGLLYAAAQDVRQPAKNVVPGAVFALGGWMVLSAGYAFYVENFSNYSVIYGALGTVIVLMIWLYLTATVLILGAELNDTLLTLRGERGGKKRKKRKKKAGASSGTDASQPGKADPDKEKNV